MINYMFLISRQGKVRLAKWYTPVPKKERVKIVRDICGLTLNRSGRFSNILEYRGTKVVSKRYASLYFIAGITNDDNELITLEVIHQFVEVLDRYFGNVCELDLIYNFHRAYFVLDEVILGGELQESSKKLILKYVHTQDNLAEESDNNSSSMANVAASYFTSTFAPATTN